ncbi:MAG TPA: phosphohydrolase, partial [Deltaproteobacteria bacterium]|nr:phosphohydrolase [Deltaproteobacteria bacterium]
AKGELIEEVCVIIAHHHHPGTDETINYQCLYDADLIVNLEENQKESPSEPEKLKKTVESAFLTESGRNLAGKVLL